MTATSPLVVASASPRRHELLRRVGLVFVVRPADIDETPFAGENPTSYVERLALAKAKHVASAGAVTLAADTTVTFAGVILGKPADAAEAKEMLRCLNGRTHQVITGYAIVDEYRVLVRSVSTDVTMVGSNDAALDAYVASNEWRGKAGGYAVQGIAEALVHRVNGSISNVVGLPLADVLSDLRTFGILARLAEGIAQ